MIAADAQQSDVFSSVGQPICEGALSSFSPTNSVLFSFGVSNSGKTWTLLGGEGEDRGVLPRIVEGLFAEEVTSVGVSMLEIYNESLYDLLAASSEEGGAGEANSSSSSGSSTPKARR